MDNQKAEARWVQGQGEPQGTGNGSTPPTRERGVAPATNGVDSGQTIRQAGIDLGEPFYEKLAREVGRLVTSKQEQYGDSVGRSGGIMRILYPNGIAPYQMDDALIVVRIIDKLCRLAQREADGLDRGGESPHVDLCGYALLGIAQDRRRQASSVAAKIDA